MTLFQLYHNGEFKGLFENFFDAVEYAEIHGWFAEDCEIEEVPA